MKQKILLIAFLLILQAYTQAIPANRDSSIALPEENIVGIHKNSVGVTFRGTSVWWSMDYGRVLVSRPNAFIMANASIDILPLKLGIILPLSVTINAGKKNFYFETGPGFMYWINKSYDSKYFEVTVFTKQITVLTGIRFFTGRKHTVSWRIYLNTFIHYDGEPLISGYKYVGFPGGYISYHF